MSNTTHDMGEFCHDDDQDQQQLGIGRRIQSGTVVSPMLLVVDMGDGFLRSGQGEVP